MKKILSVMVLVLLLCLMVLPTLAEGEPAFTVTPSVGELNQGSSDEITFTVSLSGGGNFTGLAFGLDFDASVFEFVDYEENAKFAQLKFTIMTFTEDTLRFACAGSNEVSYSGNVMSFTLKLKEDAKVESYTVAIKEASLSMGGEKKAAVVTPASLTVKCVHSYTWTPVEGTDTHTEVCTKCGMSRTVEHDWSGEGKLLKAPTCTEAGEVQHTCTYCGAEKTESVPAAGHQDMDAWKSDGSNHWHECSACGYKEGTVAHTPGEEPTDTTAQTCTVCGYVLKEALGHDYSTAWRHDGVNHWHQCNHSGCDSLGDYGQHVYDDACDITCNTCGYVRRAPHKYGEEWLSDERGHFHICLLCGLESEIVEHEPGEPATEDKAQTCTVCGFILKMPLSHEHEYGGEWKSDETGHWQTCTNVSCNETNEKQEHTWLEAVTGPDGKQIKTCTVCGYEQVVGAETEPDDTQTQPTDSEETEPTDTGATQPIPSQPSGAQENGGFPWWVVAAAAVVLLCVGIVLLVVEIVHSRKNNMHGKFSK